ADKVPDAPPVLAGAITRAMLKEPRERFASMAEFMAAVTAPDPGEAAPAPKSRWKRTESKKKAAPRPATGSAAKAEAAGGDQAAAAGQAVAADPPQGTRRRAGIKPVMVVAGLGLAVFAAVLATRGGAPGASDFQPISAIGGLDTNVPAEATTQDATAPVAAPPAAQRGTPPPPPSGRRTGRNQPAAAAPARGGTEGPGGGNQDQAETGAQACARLFAASDWADGFVTCSGAAEAGDPASMRRLAQMFDRGNGTAENPARAVEWYRRAAPRDAEAKFQLSRMVEIGRGTQRDARANVALLREAAAMGHTQAILTLASRLENNAGMARDYDEAATWYQRAAENGSVQAMLKLGDWYRRGRGVQKDEARGVEYFRRAGEAGSATGAWEAARAYLEGRGVDRNEETGMTLLRSAARLGSQEATQELRKRGG
ncbi:MAG TPA: hypothetical protein PLL69_02200, partial [Gemmatimonadales bacterium]|nr:hypothetical protein [Gemmatimonadales bacterium]